MEIKLDSTNLASYIKVFDNVIHPKTLENFTKVCNNHLIFQDAGVVALGQDGNTSDVVVKKTRDTKMCTLKNVNEKSVTNIHWANFFLATIKHNLNNYIDLVTYEKMRYNIEVIQVLKYGEGGHYKFHHDHGIGVPRTFSVIYFVNDDYEGGELVFRNPDGKTEINIDKIKNRMIIWPSNFMYPHAVKPVTKGIRYSLVSWAL